MSMSMSGSWVGMLMSMRWFVDVDADVYVDVYVDMDVEGWFVDVDMYVDVCVNVNVDIEGFARVCGCEYECGRG